MSTEKIHWTQLHIAAPDARDVWQDIDPESRQGLILLREYRNNRGSIENAYLCTAEEVETAESTGLDIANAGPNPQDVDWTGFPEEE